MECLAGFTEILHNSVLPRFDYFSLPCDSIDFHKIPQMYCTVESLSDSLYDLGVADSSRFPMELALGIHVWGPGILFN
jgi:hypothetical protein